MSSLDTLIQKIPRPVLVIAVLALALGLIVWQNPLQDGCSVESKNFTRTVRGVLVGYKTKSNKTQLAQIDMMKSLCREGNSAGACENYYAGLKKIVQGLKLTSNQCLPKLIEDFPSLSKAVAQGLVTMALNAWGEKPPTGLNERLGWLTEADIYTFCGLRRAYPQLTSQEDYESLRASVYKEFPAAWPENLTVEQRADSVRPRALKSADNPDGTLSADVIYKLSLFSLRCDAYQ